MLSIIINIFLFPLTELSLQTSFYWNGEPIPDGNSSPVTPRPASELDPLGVIHTPSDIHPLRPPIALPSAHPVTHTDAPPAAGFEQHRLLKSGLHVHQYSFPANAAKLRTKSASNFFVNIIPNIKVYTVISTPKGDVLGTLDKNNVRRGLYNLSEKRQKINMQSPYIIKKVTPIEGNQCPLGKRLKEDDYID